MVLKKGDPFDVVVDGVTEHYVITQAQVSLEPGGGIDLRLKRIRDGDLIGADDPEPGLWSRVWDRRDRAWTNIRGVWVSDVGVRRMWRYLVGDYGPLTRLPDLPPELAAQHIRIRPHPMEPVAEAIRVAVRQNVTSVSSLAAWFGIDYAKARRLADVMESWGVIGAGTEWQSTPVLMTAAEAEEVIRTIERT